MKKLLLAAVALMVASSAFALSSDMRVLKSELQRMPDATRVDVMYPTVSGYRLLSEEAGSRFDWGYTKKHNAKLFCKYLGEGWSMESYESEGFQFAQRVATLDDPMFGGIKASFKNVDPGEDDDGTLIYASITCVKASAEPESSGEENN